MPVQFVIGRAGSGKTRRCLHSIADALRAEPLGPPLYWILPRQATFMAERDLTCAVGLAGFCRARVVSFETLDREVFADVGGDVGPQVTPLGRQMILGHLLRQLRPKLKFFSGSARQPGLAVELDATFAELERAGKTPADLAALVSDMEATGPHDADGVALLAKMRDVHLLYDAYSTFLGRERLDPHGRLQRALESIEHCRPLRGSTVYVDGFADFSDAERRTLAAVAKVAARMEVMVLADPNSKTIRDAHHLPDEMGLFHRTERAYRKLWFAFAEAGVTVLEPVLLGADGATPARFHDSPDLAHVERGLFPCGAGFSLPFDEGPAKACTTMVIAPDRPAEVDAAARGIRRLLMRGMRLRDIAVLVRDLEPYHSLIDASFREHGIPYFVDRRRAATHHPLLRFIRSAIQVARYEWPHDAAVALLKTGLAGVDLYEADGVENYVLAHRIRGPAWEQPEPWAYQRDLTRHDGGDEEGSPDSSAGPIFRPHHVDVIRRGVVERVGPLSALLRDSAAAIPLRHVVGELYAVLERFGVRGAIAAWAHAASDLEQRGEHEQVWSELIELLDQMVDLLGDERVTPGEFVDVLESGLERFDLALTPPTVDQVLVGQIDRTRCPSELRAAFVLGMNEGEFPRPAREVTILSDSERRELDARRNFELDPHAERRLLDENLLGYVALTRASQRLFVSRALADERGKPTEPSEFWLRLRALLPEVQPTHVPRERADDVRHIDTPRQLIVGLMNACITGFQPVHSSSAVGHTGGGDPSPQNRMHGLKTRDTAERPGTMLNSWPAVYHWLATHPCRGDHIDAMRHRAWKAMLYANDAVLSSDVARRLFPGPLQAGVSQLETFAACPFRHYLRYGLRLAGREARDLTDLDLARVYHQVLEVVVGDLFKSRHAASQSAPPVDDEMIRQYSRQFAATLTGELAMSTARNEYLLERLERTVAQVVATQHAAMRKGLLRPAHTGVAFGAKGAVPALRVDTPAGSSVLLHGRIDRVDVKEGEGGALSAAFDYRLGAGPLSLSRVYHGLSLQLLTYLLVLQTHGEELTGKPLTPTAAFYVQLLRRLEAVDHPDDAADPADEKFPLRVKPRGVFQADYLNAFDKDVEPGSSSDVLRAYLKSDGSFGFRATTDVADAGEFAALLAHVRRRLGELADRVMAGDVAVAPYYMNQETPCPRCEYRSGCRFEPATGRYRHLSPMGREGVLQRLTENADR